MKMTYYPPENINVEAMTKEAGWREWLGLDTASKAFGKDSRTGLPDASREAFDTAFSDVADIDPALVREYRDRLAKSVLRAAQKAIQINKSIKNLSPAELEKTLTNAINLVVPQFITKIRQQFDSKLEEARSSKAPAKAVPTGVENAPPKTKPASKEEMDARSSVTRISREMIANMNAKGHASFSKLIADSIDANDVSMFKQKTGRDLDINNPTDTMLAFVLKNGEQLAAMEIENFIANHPELKKSKNLVVPTSPTVSRPATQEINTQQSMQNANDYLEPLRGRTSPRIIRLSAKGTDRDTLSRILDGVFKQFVPRLEYDLENAFVKPVKGMQGPATEQKPPSGPAATAPTATSAATPTGPAIGTPEAAPQKAVGIEIHEVLDETKRAIEEAIEAHKNAVVEFNVANKYLQKNPPDKKTAVAHFTNVINLLKEKFDAEFSEVTENSLKPESFKPGDWSLPNKAPASPGTETTAKPEPTAAAPTEINSTLKYESRNPKIVRVSGTKRGTPKIRVGA